jgi:hypothetical protein
MVSSWHLLARFELQGQTGVFLTCSRFNHACHPYTNCTYKWDKERECMVVSTLRRVKQGDELTISYMGWSVDRNLLKENYGFECDCPGCLGVESTEGQSFVEEKTSREEACSSQSYSE